MENVTDVSAQSTSAARESVSTRHNTVNVVDEYVDRERRKCNLVVYGLAESIESSTTESGSKDASGFQELTKDIKVNNVQVTKVSRLGKIQTGKQRPLSVDSERAKWSVLKSAPMLRRCARWQSDFISPDLTIKEREIKRALYQELKRRKEAGEKDLVIKRGKIINRRGREGSDYPTTAVMELSSTS